jgi:hypothetical protein
LKALAIHAMHHFLDRVPNGDQSRLVAAMAGGAERRARSSAAERREQRLEPARHDANQQLRFLRSVGMTYTDPGQSFTLVVRSTSATEASLVVRRPTGKK